MFAPRDHSAAPFTRNIMPSDAVPSPPAAAATQAASVSLPVTSAKWRKPTRLVARASAPMPTVTS